MNQRTLSKTLRRRLARQFHKGDVAARSDEQILDAYLVCAKCSTGLFADPQAAVSNATSAEEFLSLVNMALASHRCPASN